MRTVTCALGIIATAAVVWAQQPAPVGQAAPAPAAFAGMWEVDDQPAWRIELETTGTTVTGRVIQANQEVPIPETKIDGDRITFTVKSLDGDRTITFMGTLKGDVLTFKRTAVVREGGNAGGPGMLGGPAGPPELVTRRAAARWTGTIRNGPTPRNANPAPQPRIVTLGSRKMPDPHWRWRGGEKELTVRVFTMGNQSFQISSVDETSDRLTFSFSRPGPGDEVSCSLTRQADGTFAGRCQSDSVTYVQLLQMTPPKG